MKWRGIFLTVLLVFVVVLSVNFFVQFIGFDLSFTSEEWLRFAILVGVFCLGLFIFLVFLKIWID
ncbi:hypothetical protein [Halobacillus sp. H74]|uniref:hypothetical protein n=1 Tax=Halobacillus sp. H74 TaxID=3457436 RepID=UPI003FCE7761